MIKTFVTVHDSRWKKYKIDFAKIVNAAAGKGGRDVNKNAEVSIILTNDSEIQKINKQYRGIDRATNVLSFETGDDELLGDIFISIDTVMQEAKEQGGFINHATHMVVHGVLHLLGHDHIKDSDAELMESTETKVLKDLGIDDPYREIIDTRYQILDTQNYGNAPVRAKSISSIYYLVSIICGGIAALGFAPFNLWPLTMLGIAAAYYLIMEKSRRVFWPAFAFGAGYSVSMFWWILNSIYVVPELAAQFAIWTAPALIGIGLAGGLIFGAPFWLTRASRASGWRRTVTFAAAWTFVLWLREWMLTGFPFNPVANIMLPYPILANTMSLWGAFGLTFFLVGISASATHLFRFHREWRLFVLLLTILGIGGFYGYHNMQKSMDAKPLNTTVSLVQPSLPQGAKMSAESVRDNLRFMVEHSDAADIIIWPETSYPLIIKGGDDFPIAKLLNTTVVTGAISYKDGSFYNSLIVADSKGAIENIYSKSHLVPFGEYRPFGDIIPTPGELTAGSGPRILRAGGISFAPAVCYEIVFSDSVIPHGATPDAIINITNDSWFGATPGSYQHLDMARRYAIESGAPVLRAAYSGISAVIGADGKIIESIGIGEVGTIVSQVPGGAHMTPYRYVGRERTILIILILAICAVSIRVSPKKD